MAPPRHQVTKNEKFLQILNQRQILFKMSHQVTRYLKIWLFWFWLENRTWFAESNHLGQTSQIGKWLFSRLWVMWYLIGKIIWRWFRICKNFSFLGTRWRHRAEILILIKTLMTHNSWLIHPTKLWLIYSESEFNSLSNEPSDDSFRLPSKKSIPAAAKKKIKKSSLERHHVLGSTDQSHHWIQ